MRRHLPYHHILILADIEGSSGCGSYRASSFLTRPWARACAAMSRDVNVMITGCADVAEGEVQEKKKHGDRQPAG